jgi:hypothetical protein
MMTANLDALELRLKKLESANETGKATTAILAQFYTAEYSAMMARVSAWANLQYVPWPILVAAVGLVSQIQVAVNIRMWAAVILTLVVYVAYQGTMVNSLYYVLLIERYLRPLASDLVHTEDFWIHERVFQKVFPQNPGWWEYWPPVISFLGISAVVGWNWYLAGWSWYLYGKDWVNIVGLVIALGLGLFVAVLTRNGKRLKDDIIETCKASKMVIDEPVHASRAAAKAQTEASQEELLK